MDDYGPTHAQLTADGVRANRPKDVA